MKLNRFRDPRRGVESDPGIRPLRESGAEGLTLGAESPGESSSAPGESARRD